MKLVVGLWVRMDQNKLCSFLDYESDFLNFFQHLYISIANNMKIKHFAVHPELPKRHGLIHGLEKFDASFFNVDAAQAHVMDPMGRMTLEHAIEALIDAGYNPCELRGTNTGVYVGACYSETEKKWLYEKIKVCWTRHDKFRKLNFTLLTELGTSVTGNE